MESRIRHSLAAACAVLALGLSGCATDGDTSRRSAGQFTDDAALTAKVKTAIATDVGTGTAAAINVNTYRGEVQLTGFVDTAEQVRRAETAAKSVEGVRVVRNSVRVKG
jgi:hyperosmotically inducible protein